MLLPYFFQSPYLFDEMNRVVVRRNQPLQRKHKQALVRYRRGDHECTSLVDDKGKIGFVPGHGGDNRPIGLWWTDGSKRYMPFNLALAVAARKQGMAKYVIHIMGGSLGLNARILDDKVEFKHLINDVNKRTYVPW